MRAVTNRFIGINYIDDNRNMEVPPEYWLQRLYDYDAELVVFPSRYRPFAYVLARRQRLSRGMRDQALEDTITQPDTKLCLSRGLVPVTLIFRTGVTWSIDNIIAQLQSRDIWAHGGGEKAADTLEAAEQRVEQTRQKDLRDDMWMRSGQAWESYQRRTGQRVTSPGMGSGRHVPTASPSGSIGGSGLVITG
jgi:hypothetical protein